MDESLIFGLEIEQNHSSPITKFITDRTNTLLNVDIGLIKCLMDNEWMESVCPGGLWVQKFGRAAVEAVINGMCPREFREEVTTLLKMEGRDIMPPELFTIIQGRVELQAVREEERRKHGGK